MTAPPDDFTVRSADWLAGYAEGWKARDAETRPPQTCTAPGCSRLVLRDPESGRCHQHRGVVHE